MSTTTIYQTSTVAERPAWSTFKAQASINQHYLVAGTQLYSNTAFFQAPTFAEGHLFAIDPSTCWLIDITGGTRRIARGREDRKSTFVTFFSAGDPSAAPDPPLLCSVDANTRALSCDNKGRSYDVDSLDCIDSWEVGYADFNVCEVGKFTITVFPAL